MDGVVCAPPTGLGGKGEGFKNGENGERGGMVSPDATKNFVAGKKGFLRELAMGGLWQYCL